MVRIAGLLLAAIAVALCLSGCGGGSSGGTPPAVSAALFVPNYVSSVSLLHWNHLPMRVSFNLPSNWSQLYASDPNLEVDAANEWNQAGQQAFIQVVPLGAPADVVVQFVAEANLNSTRVWA